MKNLMLSRIAVLLLFIVLGSATFVNDDCDSLRKENERLKQDLAKTQQEAERAMKMADAASQEARRQQTLALKSAKFAREAQAKAEHRLQEVRDSIRSKKN